jgi:hypothetical protein
MFFKYTVNSSNNYRGVYGLPAVPVSIEFRGFVSPLLPILLYFNYFWYNGIAL